MSFWRSIEFRLAAWYSLLLMAGLASLGAVLWLGVNYSMVAAVDDLLSARVDRLVDFVEAEFGDGTAKWITDEEGEFDGHVERVDPEQGWFSAGGIKIRLAPETEFNGNGGPFGAADLRAGQFVEVVVRKSAGAWVATEVSLETGFHEELQEELSEYAIGVPDGNLIDIRGSGGQRVLPVDDGSGDLPLAPWQEPQGRERTFLTLETAEGPYRVLNRDVNLAGGLYRIQLASPLAAVTATRERLLSWLVWVIPAGVLVSFSGGYFISRAALRPVEKVVDVAGRMNVERLSERIEVPRSGDVVQRLAETFNEMLARLERSVNRLEEFTADASHELRSPVSVIRTTAELALRQARTDEDLRRDMRQIHDEASGLTELIEDLLALARADSGADSEPMTRIDLGALTREVTERYRRPAARKLELEIEAKDPIVRGHAASLRRLLVILLDNAIQHTPEDASIHVAVRHEDNRVSLCVTDTGEGIPPEELNRIFDRFYRVDPSRNRSNGGAGLGLSIAKWIAEFHGGRLTAKSEFGLGSTFSVCLPRFAEAASSTAVK